MRNIQKEKVKWKKKQRMRGTDGNVNYERGIEIIKEKQSGNVKKREWDRGKRLGVSWARH